MNSINEAQIELTPKNITSLCNEAEAASSRAGRHKRMVPFKWKGCRYKVGWTSFRMIVQTPQGKPVACRWL